MTQRRRKGSVTMDTTFAKKTFISEVIKTLPHMLPNEYEDAEIKVEEFRKLDDTYTSVVVRKKSDDGVSVCPGLNMDLFYDEYRKGKPFHEIMQKLVEIVLTPAPTEIIQNLHMINDYEQVKKFLSVRLSNQKKNQYVAKNAPYQMVTEDLMVTAQIVIQQDDGMASCCVSNDLRDQWGITNEQLFKEAWANSEVLLPGKVSNIFEELGIEEDDEDDDHKMLVISNDKKTNGACVLFYSGIIEQLKEAFDGDFYVLPSSVHEVLALTGKADATALLQMVHDVNLTQVEPKDWLSDCVYHYDSEKGKLETIYPTEGSISICS